MWRKNMAKNACSHIPYSHEPTLKERQAIFFFIVSLGRDFRSPAASFIAMMHKDAAEINYICAEKEDKAQVIKQ